LELSGEVRSRRQRHETSQGAGFLWAVVLAGGEGVRLRPLVRRVFGDERPKQFCPLLGPRTLLRQTLDRVGRLIPPDRTVVVGLESHERYLAQEFGEPGGPHVLKQPASRGTAAAVLFATQWIGARDPRATVVFFPADQFIQEEGMFMEQVSDAAKFVRLHPRWMVLLGVQPDEPETEYGWIEPGERVAWTGHGPLYRVRQFREKPSKEAAQTLFVQGGLWNTLVFVAEVGALWATGRECVPSLSERIARLSAFWGSEHERWAVRQAYALAPTVNFSQAILEACTQPLAVLKVPSLTWCDLGSPDRVLKTLAGCRIEVPAVGGGVHLGQGGGPRWHP
jgi:mannose-1-phosphate guanylyltransferase